MTRIGIADLIGPDCTAPDDGHLLGHRACAAIGKGDSVLLDFTGVEAVTVPFLCAALGPVLVGFPASGIAERLKWTGLDGSDADMMRLVLSRALRFHAATDEQQAAMATAYDPATDH